MRGQHQDNTIPRTLPLIFNLRQLVYRCCRTAAGAAGAVRSNFDTKTNTCWWTEADALAGAVIFASSYYCVLRFVDSGKYAAICRIACYVRVCVVCVRTHGMLLKYVVLLLSSGIAVADTAAAGWCRNILEKHLKIRQLCQEDIFSGDFGPSLFCTDTITRKDGTNAETSTLYKVSLRDGVNLISRGRRKSKNGEHSLSNDTYENRSYRTQKMSGIVQKKRDTAIAILTAVCFVYLVCGPTRCVWLLHWT